MTRLFPALVLPLALGCANHVHVTEFREDTPVRSVRSEQTRILTEQDPVSGERLTAHVVVDRVVEERTDRVNTVVEAYVPWGLRRELFEVPVGLLSSAFALLAHLVDVLAVGALPDDPIETYTAWTFAALNPVMNTETASRARLREVSREVHEGEPLEIRERVPLAQRRVEVAFPGAAPFMALTGAQGAVSIHLLDLPTRGLASAPRSVRVSVSPAGGTPEAEATASLRAEFFVDRTLARRVLAARPLVEALRAPDTPAADLARALYRLDRAGFSAYSFKLEDELQRRLRDEPDRVRALRADLERLYGHAASFPAAPE